MQFMPNFYQCVYCKHWLIDEQQRFCHLSVEMLNYIAHTVIILKYNLKGKIKWFQIPWIQSVGDKLFRQLIVIRTWSWCFR